MGILLLWQSIFRVIVYLVIQKGNYVWILMLPKMFKCCEWKLPEFQDVIFFRSNSSDQWQVLNISNSETKSDIQYIANKLYSILKNSQNYVTNYFYVPNAESGTQSFNSHSKILYIPVCTTPYWYYHIWEELDCLLPDFTTVHKI